MPVFGYRLTTDPDPRELLKVTRSATDTVMTGQLGHAPTEKERAMTIGKKKEEGGLGLEGRAWEMLVRQIVVERLYKHQTYGSNFQKIVVTSALCAEYEKLNLNQMAMNLALAVFDTENKNPAFDKLTKTIVTGLPRGLSMLCIINGKARVAMGVAVVMSTLALGSSHAEAQGGAIDLNKSVFTKANQKSLCITQNGQRVVNRAVLASRLIAVGGGVTLDLLSHANAEGVPDPNSPVSDKNAIYFVSNPYPFGRNKEYTGEFATAHRQQRMILLTFENWLFSDNKLNTDYELVPGTAPPPDGERYFQPANGFEIRCKGDRPSGGGGQAKPDQKDDAGRSWLKSVVIRKTVADVAVPASQLKKANGAQLSFNDDVAAGKTTASIEGLVGVIIAGSFADRAQELSAREKDTVWANIVPYVYVKKVTSTPSSKAKKDIDYATPGVAANITYVKANGTFGFDLQLDGAVTADREYDSTSYSAGLRFAPSFYDGTRVILGAPIGFGPIAVRPDLFLVARQVAIEDAGTNPELLKLNSYTSFGFDATGQFYLDSTNPLLASFVARIGYTLRENSNGVADVRRFNAGLSYVLSTNVTLDLDYINGRDVTTLQDEERWTASVSVRY